MTKKNKKPIVSMTRNNKILLISIVIGFIVVLGLAIFFRQQNIKVGELDIKEEYDLPENYAIEDNLIYVDDENAYISAAPHTITDSGWVYFTVNSKVYSGNVDVYWGFDTEQIKPVKAELYKPHDVNTFRHDYISDGNESEWIKVYFNETKEWLDISSSFDSINYDYGGMNKWWYLKDVNINKNQDYIIRVYIRVPRGDGFNPIEVDTKYWFAIKPSSETIGQAISNGHFYTLDPWFDSGGTDQNLDHLSVDLQAYYTFNETADGQNATDIATGLHNCSAGILSNHSTTEGLVGDGVYHYGAVANQNLTCTMTLDRTINATSFSVSVWVKDSSARTDSRILGVAKDFTGGAANYMWRIMEDPNQPQISIFTDGADWNPDPASFAVLGANEWSNLIITWNQSNLTNGLACAYQNGTLNSCAITGVNLLLDPSEIPNLTIGNLVGLDLPYGGHIDELAIWNKTLNSTEVSEIWNGGNGIVFGVEPPAAINVTIDSPLNNSNSSDSTLEINYTVELTETTLDSCWYSNDTMLVNVSLGIGGSCTNVTGVTWSEGGHNVTVWANDTLDNLDQDSVTFFIDSTLPVVNITFPTIVNHQILNRNLTFNWTISDDNLESCWYDYNTTNTTVTCGDNYAEINITSTTNRNVTLYANDSAGNEGSSFQNWTYRFLENKQTFTASVLEGSTQTFLLNGTIGSDFAIASGSLFYDDVINSASTSVVSGDTIFQSDISIPNVAALTNKTFFWSLIFSDGENINLSSDKQEVVTITADNCTTNTYLILNISIFDEDSQVEVNISEEESTIESDITIFQVGTSTSIVNHSLSHVNTNPAQVCLSLDINNTEYTIDAQIKYNSTLRETEFYHLQNTSLTNVTAPIKIDLYDLLSTNSQDFIITFTDEFFSGVENALLQIQRKYIDEGVFKTVEIPKTDANGEAVAHLIVNNAIYTIIVTKDGEILSTFANVYAKCQNPALETCEIDLSSFASHLEPEDYTSLDDFEFTPSFNRTTRELKVIYTVPSGSVATVSLNANLSDSLGTTNACSTSLTSSSGTLTCTIAETFGNGSVVTSISKDGVLISQGVTSLSQTASDNYGLSVVFMSLILTLTLILMGVSGSPMMLAIFLILGAILNIAFNLIDTGLNTFIGAGATVLWIIIALIIIIIKGNNRT